MQELDSYLSGTHGLNEELGRHRGREGKSECTLCGAECESMVHVLWECSAYSSIYSRASFMLKLEELLGDRYADFELLNSVEKTSYILGSEHWEQNFKSLLSLVKEFIVNMWEVRKQQGMLWRLFELLFAALKKLHLTMMNFLSACYLEVIVFVTIVESQSNTTCSSFLHIPLLDSSNSERGSVTTCKNCTAESALCPSWYKSTNGRSCTFGNIFSGNIPSTM